MSTKTQNTASPVIASVPSLASFGTRLAAVTADVRWSDVVSCASELSELVAESAKDPANNTPAKVARKVATVSPSKVLAFRIALCAYAAAKSGEVNPTQRAELASKLPALSTKGKLTERAANFGGIVLPPLMGDL